MIKLARLLEAFARIADAIVDAIGRSVAWLVLFVIAALFAQWPLREWLGSGHILANDFGQIAHAAVFAIGVVYALRWDGHVRLDIVYQRMSERGRAWVDLAGSALVVAPWSAFVLWFSLATTQRSVAVLERFPETWSPGYWIFKVILVAFTALLLLQALGHIARDVARLLGASPHGAAPQGTA